MSCNLFASSKKRGIKPIIDGPIDTLQTAIKPVTHVIRKGETLSSIAGKYENITYQEIAQANGISNPNNIYVGQQLKIPNQTSVPQQPSKPIHKSISDDTSTGGGKKDGCEKCKVDNNGFLINIKEVPFIKKHISRAERGKLKQVNAIVVHRTAGSKLSFSNAKNNGIAAHFYIDKDGTVYQIASLNKVCYHVGKIKSRAKEEGALTKKDQEFFQKIKWNPSKEYQYEKKKQYPIRYPHNYDSIGIETVGSYNTKTKKWEDLTTAQKKSFAILYNCLTKTLKLNKIQNTYTHEQISRKTKGEGQTVLEAVKGLI